MLDLKKLSVSDDFDDGLRGQRVWDKVRLGKTEPNEWFKGFKLGDKEGLNNFIKVVTTTQPDKANVNQTYLLAPHIAAAYKDYLKPISTCILFYGYTTRGIIFISPVKVSDTSNSWNDTSKTIHLAALNEWTQIQSNRVEKCYVHLRMSAKNQEETKEPFKQNEPPIPYEEAIKKAFLDRVVENEEHPIIKNVGVIV